MRESKSFLSAATDFCRIQRQTTSVYLLLPPQPLYHESNIDDIAMAVLINLLRHPDIWIARNMSDGEKFALRNDKSCVSIINEAIHDAWVHFIYSNRIISITLSGNISGSIEIFKRPYVQISNLFLVLIFLLIIWASVMDLLASELL